MNSTHFNEQCKDAKELVSSRGKFEAINDDRFISKSFVTANDEVNK